MSPTCDMALLNDRNDVKYFDSEERWYVFKRDFQDLDRSSLDFGKLYPST